jgi:hypothetical protein
MHVSNRNIFPTTINLQIRVHVYRPRLCVVETDQLSVALFRWLPIMTSWKDKPSWMLRYARTHSWQWLLRNLSVSCRVNHFLFFAIILMWYTRNIFLFQSPRKSSNLGSRAYYLSGRTELSAVKYCAICS